MVLYLVSEKSVTKKQCHGLYYESRFWRM